MTGIIALQGGGPFSANDELDARLLAEVGVTSDAGRVVVLPTADAFEQPERLIVLAMSWAERLGVEVEALMVLRRGEAMEMGAATVVRNARAIYLVGDQPLHLRSVLKDTPTWAAVHQVLVDGGLVVGVGASASALCDPMVDPRGGAFTLGLGLIEGLAFVNDAESWSADRMHRTLELADVPVGCAPAGSALVRRGSGWEIVGDVVIHGDLPGPTTP